MDMNIQLKILEYTTRDIGFVKVVKESILKIIINERNRMLSLFVLAGTLFVWAAGQAPFNWIDPAPKLVAVLAMVFVFVVVIESVLIHSTGLPKWYPLRRKVVE